MGHCGKLCKYGHKAPEIDRRCQEEMAKRLSEAVEIRWHGRGGQGAKTACLLLADCAFSSGKHVQGFPEYGPERIAREKAKKIARIEKHQEEKERRKREGKRPKPSIIIHYPEREQPGLESSVPVPEETESAPEGEHSDPESSVPALGEAESTSEGELSEKLIT